MASRKVVLVGDPIVDVVAHVSYEFLQSLEFESGGCLLVEERELHALLDVPEIAAQLGRRTLGGSAANVSKSLAVLCREIDVRFCGMVGNDAASDLVIDGFTSHGVVPELLTTTKSTAMCLCLVTPDGQRTMRTCLAAAADLQRDTQVPDDLLEHASLLHCEGYCLYRPELPEGLFKKARSRGAIVSLDLASMEIVRSRWDMIMCLLSQGLVDILFCNDQEAAAVCQMAGICPELDGKDEVHKTGSFTPLSYLQRAASFICQHCKLCIISRGPEGCYVRTRDGSEAEGRTHQVHVEDTVGAGDAFTAGAFWGMLSGMDIDSIATVGCRVGTLAVQTSGGEIPRGKLEELRREIASAMTTRESVSRAEAGWKHLTCD